MGDLQYLVSLRNRLMSLGYHEYQIENICQEALGSTWQPEDLPAKEQKQLIEAMEEYIMFAKKCRTIK